VKLRRLEADDAPAFQRLRIEGFALQPREFRYAPEDEADTPLAEVAACLARDLVVGVFQGDTLVGIAGLTRHGGVKINPRRCCGACICAPNFAGKGARTC
jgi:NADH:ubiquinone oxidoreductase subunit E